ncbi:MAG: hypothetical protein E5V16_02540 [Mesorhizobium sp.]|nr:MAG: hypothetical protein E5V16_02540 [Mesorhizobium sp.]
MLPLWCGDYLKFRFKPESASWPLAMLWDEYMREISHHRDLLRDQGEMSMIDHRFHAWRERQIRRCNHELGQLAPSITLRRPALASATGPQIRSTTRTTTVFC